jgi:hypothetical protein
MLAPTKPGKISGKSVSTSILIADTGRAEKRCQVEFAGTALGVLRTNST